MLKYIKKFLLHPLISGSIIVTLGSLFANFVNFIFNVFISRNLSVQSYGTVASLIAIITLFGISAGAIIPTIVNFTGQSFIKNDHAHVRGVYLKILKPLLIIAGLVLLFFTIFNSYIASFLNISGNSNLILLTGVIIFFGFAGVLNLALFQSSLSFKLLSGLNIFSSFMKLTIGTILVLLGFQSIGVMVAILISYIVPYIIGFTFLKFLFDKKVSKVKVNFSEIIKYAAPSGLALLALTSLSSVDLVLVKHLFDENSAGIYAGLSLIGRVIFFFTAPIGMVMFPLMTRKHANNEAHGSILFLALFLVGIASGAITIFYFLFPEFTINLFLKNREYLAASSYLGFFGVFMTLYSMCSVMMYYFLSIRKTWIYRPILIAALFQISGIYFFHNSFGEIISISVFSITALSTFFVLYFLLLNRQK